MKKLFLLAAGLFLSGSAMSQVSFGLTAGYTNMSVSASNQGLNASVDGSGFFIGALADFAVSEAFHIQPGANYSNVEDSNMLYVPIMAKYYIGDSQFNLQAGPQAAIILDEVGGMNAFGLDLGFGAGFDITENFFLEGRYAFEVTNRMGDEFADAFPQSDAKVRINTLQVGIGYKF